LFNLFFHGKRQPVIESFVAQACRSVKPRSPNATRLICSDVSCRLKRIGT
jgi:hypothetical protein